MPYQSHNDEKKIQVFSNTFSTLADLGRLTKENLRYTSE